jgi:hypothetical protein
MFPPYDARLMARTGASTYSRREVLRLAAAGVGGLALVGPMASPVAAARSEGVQPAGPPSTLADFTSLVNTAFDVKVGVLRTTPLILVDAVAIAPRGLGKRRVTGEAFSLLFTGATPLRTAGEIFPVRHPALGEFSMFLAPVGSSKDGLHYEAVYNHHALAG